MNTNTRRFLAEEIFILLKNIRSLFTSVCFIEIDRREVMAKRCFVTVTFCVDRWVSLQRALPIDYLVRDIGYLG